MQVVKRDGRIVDFDKNKIVTAIMFAFKDVDDEITSESWMIAESIASDIEDNNESEQYLNVEDIQDLVEEALMGTHRKDVAKAYILYRSDRTQLRYMNDSLIKKISQRIKVENVENSNANVDEKSFSGREKESNSDLNKFIALELGGLSKEVAQAHNDMLIYQHDLEKAIFGVHNCLFLDFQQLFENGFRTRNGDVRKPSSFSTACQLVAVAFQCQSQVQFGGVGTIHYDTDLAPFVKMSFAKHLKDGIKWLNGTELELPKSISVEDEYYKEKFPKAFEYALDMLEKEGKQASQGLYHNLNTLESRQGSQVPFTSINLGRDITPEGRLVSKWALEASIDGIGKYHTTSIFPISIWQFKDGVNAKPGDPNYDLTQLALKSMSKRIYPNWCNCDWSEAHEDENNADTRFATMGCRTLIGSDINGLGYTRKGRGNNVPNTIILPKLGIEYGICLGKREKPDLEGFRKAFEETLLLCEKSLLERFEIMKKQSPSSAPFMYQNGTIQDADKCDDTVFNSLKHNTLAIGYLGVAEMCQALFGKNHAQDRAVCRFALSIVKRINEFAKEASKRNQLNFSCYATPAEGLSHTALKALRKQYGVIENVTSHEYITNSHHVPVWEKLSIYDKLEIEAPFCKYPTGGCITYVELDSTFVKNTKAVKAIIDYAFKDLDIPYLAFNFPIDTCLNCGYQSEINDVCPQCGDTNIQHLRRVTGYLTADYKTGFNAGKRAEVEERVKHSQFTNEDRNIYE